MNVVDNSTKEMAQKIAIQTALKENAFQGSSDGVSFAPVVEIWDAKWIARDKRLGEHTVALIDEAKFLRHDHSKFKAEWDNVVLLDDLLKIVDDYFNKSYEQRLNDLLYGTGCVVFNEKEHSLDKRYSDLFEIGEDLYQLGVVRSFMIPHEQVEAVVEKMMDAWAESYKKEYNYFVYGSMCEKLLRDKSVIEFEVHYSPELEYEGLSVSPKTNWDNSKLVGNSSIPFSEGVMYMNKQMELGINEYFETKANESLKDTRFFVCSEANTDVSVELNKKLSQNYGKIQMYVVPESKMENLCNELQYAKGQSKADEKEFASVLQSCSEFGFEILSDNKDSATVSLNAFSNSADSCVLNTTVEEQTIIEAIETNKLKDSRYGKNKPGNKEAFLGGDFSITWAYEK